ncbi:hypothetical protein Ahy_B02g059573 isoform E [Arachis hypogaea]|uniref:Uncharacterized protein n=1 Tax=Arachis hypogaea TaxID=3818 RepID=A0A445AGU2_ARAHY|nr:hypothetical protein Ahy_B02g059573 isoform E [Arachis hypogaea]
MINSNIPKQQAFCFFYLLFTGQASISMQNKNKILEVFFTLVIFLSHSHHLHSPPSTTTATILMKHQLKQTITNYNYFNIKKKENIKTNFRVKQR